MEGNDGEHPGEDDESDDLAPEKDRPTSLGWYGVSFGLLVIAGSIAITGFNQMNQSVKGMQRRIMPGRSEIALAEGRALLFYETRSQVEGEVFDDPTPLDFRCTMRDVNGREVPLTQPTGHQSYDTSDFAGSTALEVIIPAPGTYTLECSASRRFVLALGSGIGAWLIVAIVGGLFPLLGCIAVTVIVAVKRHRWHKRHRSSGAS